jgi:hypothetical protein
MAFLWLSYDGDGMTVQETAANVKGQFEDSEGDWIGLMLDPGEGGDPYKKIYVDRTRVLAIEQGSGVTEEAE